MPKMVNDKGEALYYNVVERRGKIAYMMRGIGDTVIVGRDRQKFKSRIFTQEAQAQRYLDKHGFKCAWN